MIDNRTNNAVRNIGFGVIYRMVASLGPFVMRTMILYILGSEYLGLNSLFTSLLSFLSLAELGIGQAMVYAMYKPISENDISSLNALLNLYRKLYRIIGIIILIVGISLLPFIKMLIKGTYPEDINIYLLYIIYLANTVLSYILFAYKQSLLTAYQRSDVISKRTLVIQILMYIFQASVLILYKNYYIYIIILPLSTIATNIANSYIVDKMYPDIKCSGKVSHEEEQEIKRNVFALIGTKISSIVLHSSDNLVISSFLGLVSVAEYSNYYTIINTLVGFTDIIYSSITAGLGNSIQVESKEKNLKDFRLLSFMNFWLVSWFSVCLLCLLQPFMRLWVGEKLMLSNTMSLFFACYFFIYQINKIVLTYKDAAGIWWEDRLRPYVMMGVNVIFSIILVQYIELYGVILATLFSLIISIPWSINILYKFLFKTSSFQYYKNLLKIILVTIVIAIITYGISGLIEFDNEFISMLIKALLAVIMPNFMLYFAYKKNIYFKIAYNRINNIVLKQLKNIRGIKYESNNIH